MYPWKTTFARSSDWHLHNFFFFFSFLFTGRISSSMNNQCTINSVALFSRWWAAVIHASTIPIIWSIEVGWQWYPDDLYMTLWCDWFVGDLQLTTVTNSVPLLLFKIRPESIKSHIDTNRISIDDYSRCDGITMSIVCSNSWFAAVSLQIRRPTGIAAMIEQ